MDHNWTAREIRKKFLEFFENKGHEVVPSAPIVIKGDPTLMFTNAGMNQFKDNFLGNATPSAKRVADTQKCLRVSGKHNDLEEVGHDTYHHTMFEMLGNWSFGDYFKKEAIAWAWELLTGEYGLPKDRLYVTIFEGDAGDGLKRDEDAYDNWKQWIAADRILDGNKKDNFWEMGATGPCGPSSEIHIDLRSDEERTKQDGADLVNQDHPLVVEIWNLVFIEFNRKADKSLEALPEQHVDTGMGFERLCMALQGEKSNYDTDVFTPLISKISSLTGVPYGNSEKTDIAIRVIADHVRAVSFAIADGQLPSNNGAGYVIRRILRRAIRYAFSYLNQNEAFIFELSEILAEQMGEFFPEIKDQQKLIKNVIREEEVSFLRTIELGLNRLDQIVSSLEGSTVDGKQVFELYDTFGFPKDLTGLILREKGLQYDEKGYQTEMKLQQERARSASRSDAGDWIVLKEGEGNTFIGYDQLEADVEVLRYRKVKQKNQDLYQLVLDKTPFYPEGGGQVGDNGWLKGESDKIKITDTRREHGLILHVSPEIPTELNGVFKAEVDTYNRAHTASNHSATHLLHEALREVLGSHVEQKGSLVQPNYLRFDFSHFAKLSDSELNEIERLVNDKIWAHYPLEEWREMPMEEAKQMGAMALFGEKYGDNVRVVKFGDSVELCGGTHVQNTSQIAVLKIVSEGGIAAGIRRIEAYTGKRALSYFDSALRRLDEISAEFKNPADLMASIVKLKSENADLRKQIDQLMKEKAVTEKQQWISEAEEVDDKLIILRKSALPPAAVKDLLFQLKGQYPNLVAVIGSQANGKAQLTVAFSDDLAKAKNWHAGNIVKELAREIRGGGGGQPSFATAGGSNIEGLDKALSNAKELFI